METLGSVDISAVAFFINIDNLDRNSSVSDEAREA